MSTSTPQCPSCDSEYTYELNGLFVCSMCAYEWSSEAASPVEPAPVTDSVGNVLADGDAVIIVKDLKVKGSSEAIKRGTKVKSIRLVDGVAGHDIDCRVEGFGPMQLKSSVVRKA